MLEAFDFPKEFCMFVQVLLKDASTRIEVNGSIRKVYPLASALFIIPFDVIFYLLREGNFSPKVRGITLPDKADLLNIQFADDTALFLVLSKDNIDSFVTRLRYFGDASRVRISQTKSTLLG